MVVGRQNSSKNHEIYFWWLWFDFSAPAYHIHKTYYVKNKKTKKLKTDFSLYLNIMLLYVQHEPNFSFAKYPSLLESKHFMNTLLVSQNRFTVNRQLSEHLERLHHYS